MGGTGTERLQLETVRTPCYFHEHEFKFSRQCRILSAHQEHHQKEILEQSTADLKSQLNFKEIDIVKTGDDADACTDACNSRKGFFVDPLDTLTTEIDNTHSRPNYRVFQYALCLHRHCSLYISHSYKYIGYKNCYLHF